MEPVIQLENLTKRYGSQLAVDDVSLEVPPGVVFGLLGENGAGKTTAIRIMLGLAEATAGRACVLGMASDRKGIAIRRRVGYVAEQPTLYDWMTVTEIGWFAAGFYSDGYLSEYLRLADQFGLPPRRKLKALSRGMRAKVSLALALAHDPELLVLDEPTSGLDALVRREFLESMVDRAATGKTVFLSSHQIAEVERVSDMVGILRHGRLVTLERLDTLKDQIRQLVVTLHDGAPPPRELAGEILDERRRARQWQLLVRGLAEDQLATLRSHTAVRQVDVARPSLEEIFMACMRQRTSPEQPAEEVTSHE